MPKDTHISRRTFLATAGGTMVSIGLPGTFMKLLDLEQQALATQIQA